MLRAMTEMFMLQSVDHILKIYSKKLQSHCTLQPHYYVPHYNAVFNITLPSHGCVIISFVYSIVRNLVSPLQGLETLFLPGSSVRQYVKSFTLCQIHRISNQHETMCRTQEPQLWIVFLKLWPYEMENSRICIPVVFAL